MLSRFEWDFGGVPLDQVEECWAYEFSRQSPELIELIEAWRQEEPEKHDFKSLKLRAGGAKTGIIRIKERLRWIPSGAYFTFPEWPKKPFQKIENSERKERLGAFLETEAPLREIEPHPGELMMSSCGDFIEIHKEVFGKANLSREGTSQIVLFRIPWDLPNERILDLLSKWLDAKRPREFATKGLVGGSDPSRKRRKELEQLGKYRIVRALEDQAKKSKRKIQVYLSDWEGTQLFPGQSQWIRCRKAVEPG